MTTLQHHRGITRATLGTVLAAGLIIVVAVGALLLTLNRTNHTQTTPTTHTLTASPYLPTIQTHGAGAAHLVVDPRTGQAHGTVTPPAARASQASGPCREICATAHQSPDNAINATPGNPDVSNVGRRADQ